MIIRSLFGSNDVGDVLFAFCCRVVQSQPVLSAFCVKNAHASPGLLQCPLLACAIVLSCKTTESSKPSQRDALANMRIGLKVAGAFTAQQRDGSLLLADDIGFGVVHGVLHIVPSSCSYKHRNNSEQPVHGRQWLTTTSSVLALKSEKSEMCLVSKPQPSPLLPGSTCQSGPSG